MSARSTPRAAARAAAALGTALLLAACGQTGASTRAGGDAGPVVLRIGTNETAGTPAGAQIGQFAREVDTRTHGSVRVEPVYAAVDSTAHDFDQKVAQLVVDGKLDGGNVPARAWDVLGVKTLRALNAPFLITTDPLTYEVTTGDLSPQLLAGLDGVGVTGLGLVPEGLRRLLYFGDRVLPPAEMQGRTVRAPTSQTVYAVVRALGGAPDDLRRDGKDEFSSGVADGSVIAAETAFSSAGGVPQPGTMPANVVLFPKVNSLVLNTARFRQLDEAQQTALREAAAATAGWWHAQPSADESKLAADYYARGGRVMQVDDATVAAMRAAVAPVTADLEADASTSTLIGRIRDLAARSAPPAPVMPCEPKPAGVVSPAITGVGTFPLGTYRVAHTSEELKAAGVSPEDIAGYPTSTATLTFHPDGTLLWEETDNEPCQETFGESGGRLQIVFGSPCDAGKDGNLDFSADWTLEGDHLQLSDIDAGPDNSLAAYRAIFGKGMTKIA